MNRPAILLSVCAGAVLASGPALAQTLGKGGGADIPWLRLGAALLLCLGLAIGAAFALHHRLGGSTGGPRLARLARLAPGLESLGGAGSARRLSDIETRRLSPQVTVSVFRCDGRSYMVAASAQGQLELVSLDEPRGDEP